MFTLQVEVEMAGVSSYLPARPFKMAELVFRFDAVRMFNFSKVKAIGGVRVKKLMSSLFERSP